MWKAAGPEIMSSRDHEGGFDKLSIISLYLKVMN